MIVRRVRGKCRRYRAVPWLGSQADCRKPSAIASAPPMKNNMDTKLS